MSEMINDANSDEKKVKNKKRKFSLRKLIYNDKYLIVFSILAAVVIWISTSMSLSPETTKTITVPLSIDFSDTAADQLGIKCYGDDKVDVDVTISCKKYLARDITSDDLKVALQTNSVTSKGNYEVPITVSAASENADFTISSYYPTTYKAYFDIEDEKTLDITLDYETEDFIADGYVMGEALLSEKTAKITGPKSYVSKVDKLVASVSFDKKLKETQSIDITAQPLDSSGNTVDYVSVTTGSENLTLTIPVLKEMTLNVTSSFTGKPDSIKESDFDVEYSTETVDAAVLEDAGISEANIGNIDFSKLTVGENKFKFDITNLEGIVILDNINSITVTVTVPDDYQESTVSVNKSSVNITNVPEGYKASVVSLSFETATLVGTQTELDNDDIGVGFVVDLSQLDENAAAGTFECDATANIENSTGCWVYGTYTAKVKLTENS